MFDFITKSKRTHKPGRAALHGGLRWRRSKAYHFIILLYHIGVLCLRQAKKIIIFPIETFPDYVKVKLCLSALFFFSSLFKGPHLACNATHHKLR